MLYAIDGIPVPQRTGILHFKSTFGDMPKAKFILDNLKPESVIGWIDYEGLKPPTYEGLMMWARMILPNYVPVVKHPGSLEMRRACKEVTGNFVRVATHVTADMLDIIHKAVESKKVAATRSMYEKYRSGKSLVIDSLGSHFAKNEDLFKNPPLNIPIRPLDPRSISMFRMT